MLQSVGYIVVATEKRTREHGGLRSWYLWENEERKKKRLLCTTWALNVKGVPSNKGATGRS